MTDQLLDADLETVDKKPLTIGALLIALIGLGGWVGGTTNWVNGQVSEEYFRRIMGWQFDGIWKAAIFQGIIEGMIYGLLFGVVFTIGFVAITRMRADWSFAKRQLKRIACVLYGCWGIGGAVAILLAFVFPEAYDQAIRGVPKEVDLRLGYAWVGGSIWGEMLGGLVAALYGWAKTRQDWKAQQRVS